MNKIKFLLCFALLVSGVEGRGQIYINSYAFGGAQLILDEYTGSTGAYSLRLLDKDYAGNCLQVLKDSTGDPTQNIGFLNNYLDTVALKNFCGSNSCRVRTWYDQSGNTRNVEQTTKANMPTIVNAGAIIYKNGKAAVDFDGINDRLNGAVISNFITNAAYTIFGIANLDAITGDTTRQVYDTDAILAGTGGAMGLHFYKNTTAAINYYLSYNYDGNVDNTRSTINVNTSYIFYAAHYSGTLYGAINNNTQTSTASGNTTSMTGTLIIGGAQDVTARYGDGKIYEIIIFNADKSSDRDGINTNINNFYSIY